jgi:hypothetical protein
MVVFDDVAAGHACQGWAPQFFFSHTSHSITPSPSHPMSPALSKTMSSAPHSIRFPPRPPSHGSAASLRQWRHAQRPVRWRPHLPSSLPSLSPRRPAGAATPLHHRRSFGHDDLEGAAAREEQVPGGAREGIRFGPTVGAAVLPYSRAAPRPTPASASTAGRVGLLPPARLPIPSLAAQAPHLLSTEEEGS